MTSRVQVVEILSALFGDGPGAEAEFIVWYGNRDGDDIDLLSVSEEAQQLCCRVGRLDLAFLAPAEFENLALRFDPVVTEPLLSGEVVWGTEGAFLDTERRLRDAEVTAMVPIHLENRSIQERINTAKWLEHLRGSGTLPSWFFINLSYAITYHVFALWYGRAGGSPLTLAELSTRGASDQANALLRKVQQAKRAAGAAQLDQGAGLLYEFEALLLEKSPDWWLRAGHSIVP